MILISSITYSQEYIPLLNDSNTWYYTYLLEGWVSQIIKIKGDTIYDSIEYKIIDYEYPTFMDWPVSGFIREDIVKQQVYFLRDRWYYDDEEMLLYDFSIEPGDTVKLYAEWFDRDTTFIVDSVSIINFSVDSNRIYYLSGPSKQPNYTYHPVWIEGIGTLGFNLFSPTYQPQSQAALSCFYSGDSLLYQSSYSLENGACYYETWSVEDLSTFNLNIFPNPFSQSINIEGDYSNSYLRIEILDITGKTLWHQQITNNTGYIRQIIELDHLLSGFYFLKLSSDNKIETIKIIKNTAYH
jgi:hypothetical protein